MDLNERSFGYLVYPNPEGGDDDAHGLGRRVIADHPETADRLRFRYRYRDAKTGEVVVEGAATEVCMSIIEVEIPSTGPRDMPTKRFPGRVTHFLGNGMKAQFVPAPVRGLIAYGTEKLTDRERVGG